MLDPDILVCEKCGSDEIVYDAWVYVNDTQSSIIFDDIYCRECEQSTHAITEKEFKEK